VSHRVKSTCRSISIIHDSQGRVYKVSVFVCKHRLHCAALFQTCRVNVPVPILQHVYAPKKVCENIRRRDVSDPRVSSLPQISLPSHITICCQCRVQGVYCTNNQPDPCMAGSQCSPPTHVIKDHLRCIEHPISGRSPAHGAAADKRPCASRHNNLWPHATAS
jgi:hypothetical protein